MQAPLQKIFYRTGVLLPGLLLLIEAQTTLAEQWTQTSAPTNYWQCIASSADGSKLVAGQWSGGVYVSTNSGGTWTPTILTNDYFSSVASSADGCKLVAATAYGPGSGGIYTSTNSGLTWFTNNVPSMDWNSAASSADGNTLVVTTLFGNGGFGSSGAVFCSTNGGINWASNTLANAVYSNPEFVPAGVAASADGKKMFVAAEFGTYRSTNSGTTWTQITNAPTLLSWAIPAQYIASSADGTKCAEIAENNYSIYVSTNSGDTWNLTSAPNNDWGYIMMSANGNIIIAMTSPVQPVGPMYISTDCGNTWTTNGPMATWSAAASSADGGKLAAAAQGDANNDGSSGPIYVSQSVVAPQMAIGRTSGSIQLSWLVPSTNFVMQQSTDLSSWADMTNSPVMNLDNLHNQVTLPSANSAGFYRLKTP